MSREFFATFLAFKRFPTVRSFVFGAFRSIRRSRRRAPRRTEIVGFVVRIVGIGALACLGYGPMFEEILDGKRKRTGHRRQEDTGGVASARLRLPPDGRETRALRISSVGGAKSACCPIAAECPLLVRYSSQAREEQLRWIISRERKIIPSQTPGNVVVMDFIKFMECFRNFLLIALLPIKWISL